MARIVFIGAGSFVFTRSLVRDILTFPVLKGSTLVLMDVNKQRLNYIRRACEALVERSGIPIRIETTMDRREALKRADAVVCTILAGGVHVWKHDVLIPKKYGIDTNIGDTRSISGMFRALRTIPVMLDICRDIEQLCPNAIFLNYTNPMAMLCRAMQKTTDLKVTGLCHSVQGTAKMLADWIGAKMKDVTYVCAGINHQAWFIEYKKKHKDVIPLIRKTVAKKGFYEDEIVRNEMCLALGYYVTESSGHSSEYNWWFRKRPDLIRKYCHPSKNWNPGKYGYIMKEYINREKTWTKEIKDWLAKDASTMSIERGNEYAACIINAYMGGQPYKFNGNVPNTGIIPNLPDDVCVEVPVLADRRGFSPIHVGPLPIQLAALNNINIAVEEMTVAASLTGDAELVYQAALYDPMCAAKLGMREIKKMVQEMLNRNKRYLPQFKNLKI